MSDKQIFTVEGLRSYSNDIRDMVVKSGFDKILRKKMDEHIEGLRKICRNRVKFIIGKNLKF